MSDQAADTLPPVDLKKLKELLPHRHPFLMIDKIVDITTETAVGIKAVTNTEFWVPGHFPEMAVMPGVLIVEAMAQTAAAWTAYVEEVDTEGKVVLFMGVDKCKFRKPVVPGDMLEIRVSLTQRRPPVWRYEGKASVNGTVVAEAQFGAMLTKPKG